ncbi:hypothetical protein ENSA5_07190 [Enhygromyxa salina]|uniref:Uncharacterized protein n=1 Tax=Enhygromyxa salina TaxID=215803 RepID=A0A2S9YHA5_9BACT|nr:hypothetical protein [Enhygromyxa salina]PRQ04488.1 hypothetical protein ENSA5_07190 [Enhygromyxa salina]
MAVTTGVSASPLDEPCRPTVLCEVRVEDLPAVLLASGDYAVSVSDGRRQALPSSGELQVMVYEPVVVKLDGAAFEGSVELSPDACDGHAHVIHAAPKPAQLLFQAGAVPLSELIVSCVAGCPYQSRTADSFPELPFPRGETEALVELEFKARGHRSHADSFKLSPGQNPIRVSLERIR